MRHSASSLLSRLGGWYGRQCDGEWEHQQGIQLDTIDNPGWHLRIDLVGTSAEGATFDPVVVERGADDWLRAQVRSGVFEAYCGLTSLDETIERFLAWAEALEVLA